MRNWLASLWRTIRLAWLDSMDCREVARRAERLKAFETMRNGGWWRNAYNDETPLMYAIDEQYGVLSSSEMVEAFEIPIASLKPAIPEAIRTKDRKVIYFSHQ
jgi:hypothetical protein